MLHVLYYNFNKSIQITQEKEKKEPILHMFSMSKLFLQEDSWSTV